MSEHDHSHDHGHDHSHDHAHDHGHGDPFHPQIGAPLDTSELDPANRSLAEALKLSFGILKLIMIALVLAFLVSGAYKVNEGEVAVELWMGKFVGPGGNAAQVKEPGAHIAWPRPIGQVIRVPTSNRQVRIDTAFWVEVPANQKGAPIDSLAAKAQLQPGTDGSLITGDKNIVHGQWTVSYQVDRDNVEMFVRNVSGSGDKNEMLAKADARVRHAAERAILHVVATVAAEDFIKGLNLSSEIARETKNKLDELGSGILITSVLSEQVTAPLTVRPDFAAVTRAVSEREKKIEEARRDAEKTLTEAAGPAHPALSLAIDYYEAARKEKNGPAAAKGESAINALLEGVPSKQALSVFEKDARADADRLKRASTDAVVGGEISRVLAEAQSFRKGATETVRAEAELFKEIYKDYKKNPQAYMALRWNQVLADIYSADIEIWQIPADANKTLYLELNSDPRIQKERETQRYRDEYQKKTP